MQLTTFTRYHRIRARYLVGLAIVAIIMALILGAIQAWMAGGFLAVCAIICFEVARRMIRHCNFLDSVSTVHLDS
ncbi:hypothetical protein A2761_01345 [Candidatus Kaiserbacteria bacterium RIFCSPHIGHO2_01_FULL_51_33]|nr:MAG: hypothetical protein A2761_01345 [Candidatus Kaiserbacteria bacterium RIFCSPHIGHO2_01_FULL_51_33]